MAIFPHPVRRSNPNDIEIEVLEPEEWVPHEPKEHPHPGPEQPETQEFVPATDA
ncbi:hypothetical protein BTM_1462 [Burkholderia thailandensis 34]|uniref:hypothetical protein n=1 Tax=Burkholderia thailandensis TaxID=57975 RepID=UPI0005D917B3|nr:hypothetical protein [Burkholderia thailandensis]AJY30661.1 hypothetical protein BTM_1462 [Burkholderia thailandensis 34]